MAIVFRAFATVAAGGSPRTVAKPSGTAEGDLLLLQYANSSDIVPSSLPGGFTLVPDGVVGGANGIYIYAKLAGDSEPADYSVTFASGLGVLGIMACYSDDAKTPIVAAVANQTNPSGNRLWPSVDVATENALLCCFATLPTNTGTTPHSGMTERWDQSGTPRPYLMTQPIAVTGATGTRTGTGTATTSKTVSLVVEEFEEPEEPVEPTPGSAIAGYRLFLLRPQVMFRARVNQNVFDYPLDQVTYDSVTLGSVGLGAWVGRTIVFGSAPGLSDLGRSYIRAAGTSNTLYFGRSSRGTHDGEVDLSNDIYIEIWDDYRVWAKIPFIDSDGTHYKDSDLAFSGQTNEPPPVCNGGPGTAATIDPTTGLITVTFPGSGAPDDMPMADGATITDYHWDVRDGTITAGDEDDEIITATFPAGFRWVRKLITDSNGKQHLCRIPVYARDPAADTSIRHFLIEQHSISKEGQELALRVLEGIPADTYPDGTLVMLWEDEPADSLDRSHMRFIGWHQSDDAGIEATRTATLRDTVLHCADVAGRLRRLPGFSQEILRVEEATTWQQMANANIRRYMHYLMIWHTTALELADWIWGANVPDLPFAILGSDENNLWDQLNQLCNALVPDRHLTCNTKGQMAIYIDPRLQDAADRNYVSVQRMLTVDDWSDIRYTGQHVPRINHLWSGAIIATEGFLVNAQGKEYLPTVFCRAPGDSPGQGDQRDESNNNQLAESQAALNRSEGHRYARLNAHETPLQITLAGGDTFGIEPANLAQFVALQLPASVAAQRGLSFSEAFGVPLELDIRYEYSAQGLVRTIDLIWERETFGLPAVTYIPPLADTTQDDSTFWPGDPWSPPPLPDLPPFEHGLVGGQEQVVAIDMTGTDPFIYRTFDFTTPSGSGGPTWQQVNLTTGETNHFSWVVDPFSPGYRGLGSAINGWVVGNESVWRLTDLFGATDVTDVHTFDVAASGSPSFHWRTIAASFGRYFPEESDNPWLLVISHYGDTTGHEGTWALRSLDGGKTWLGEVQISSHYDTGTPSRFAPIGVWMSPRTPGLAYAAAYETTANPAEAAVYRTIDWGETWQVLSATHPPDDENEPAPYWAVIQEGDTGFGPVTSWGAHMDWGASAQAASGTGLVVDGGYDILLVAPPTTKRVTLAGNWSAARSLSGSGSTGLTHTNGQPSSISRTTDFNFVTPGPNDATAQSYDLTWTAVTTWPAGTTDIQDVIDNHPVSNNDYPSWRVAASANTVGGSSTASAQIDMAVSITEIELQNGHIYTPAAPGAALIVPGNRLAGNIHVPWTGNADESIVYHGRVDVGSELEYSLWRVVGGAAIDISPSVSGRSYGVNRYGFAARTHDYDRNHVLLAGTGNGTSLTHDDDFHGIFYSADAGDTWSVVVTPVADSAAPTHRPAFEAAFGADDPAIQFYWGLPDWIGYSSDTGVTVDSRAGNLSSFGVNGLIGIAGGPLT